MTKWPMVRLADVVRHRKEFIEIDDLKMYQRCRVQLHSKGIVLRDHVSGVEIKTKKQQVCRTGDFLVAEIDAKLGGYGIVPEELNGAVVSSHYFLFDINETKLDRRFLGYFVRTPAFHEQVQAQGSTNYSAIRPSHVLQYTIPLPSLPEQQRLVEHLDDLSAKIDEANSKTSDIERDSNDLLLSAFHTIAGNADRHRLGNIAPLVRRPAIVDPFAEYPGVSVRSFGKGTFHNPPLQGSDITWEKPQLVNAGDVLISNIKAWEGAIAVARPEDDGRYGSHRYLTYVPIPNVATARFICFFLLTSEGLHHVGEASPGSADRNRTTSAKGLLEIPIPLPDYKAQLWFGELCDMIEVVRQLQAEATDKRQMLLPTILNQMFNSYDTGEEA